MENQGRRALGTRSVRWAVSGIALALTAALCSPASAVERSLAGIKIFSKSSAVLARYHSPSQVIVGRPSLYPTDMAGGAGGSGGGYPGGGGGYPGGGGGYPGGGGYAGGSSPGGLPGFGGGGYPGGGGGYPGGGGGYPGGSGGYPGGGGSPGGSGGAGADASNGEVTWIYNRPGGNSLEFTFSSDGRVIQIRATGYNKSLVRTNRGITLGLAYGSVVGKYGYPESQEQFGPILTARYTERDHAAFQFYNQKLVAVIVAAVE